MERFAAHAPSIDNWHLRLPSKRFAEWLYGSYQITSRYLIAKVAHLVECSVDRKLQVIFLAGSDQEQKSDI